MWEHPDATITALAIDCPGYVPWWPRPNVKLFNVQVHVLTETSRHAGRADILREQLDGSTGRAAEYAQPAARCGVLGSPARGCWRQMRRALTPRSIGLSAVGGMKGCLDVTGRRDTVQRDGPQRFTFRA